MTSDLGRPLIGISVSMHDFGDYGGVGVQRPIHSAGGLPVMLAQLPEAEAIDAALDRVDAVVLAPGRDIDPSRYGQEPDPLLAAVEPRRDEYELALAAAAIARGLPILGVCRGMQVLNVVRGGTMIQDVRLSERFRDHPSDPGWHAWRRMEQVALGAAEAIPEHPRHELEIAEGSILAEALGGTRATVNSFHHQALGELGDGIVATAVAPDGVIEAIELAGAPVLGVQWELQEEWRIDPRFARVFTWFIDAARARAAQAAWARASSPPPAPVSGPPEAPTAAGSPQLRPPAARLA
ncbi:MAG: gamma-glutamyl-gamma-aminobutyrate hydrolase family protein [Conexibacteraceae bacterium]|nr:gamma-glutamyl-gamma-aminobutyrate hydrolase family protein [Conexibacteraceae bacterium]